jgi:predicted ArsR family transcriptional regulator
MAYCSQCLHCKTHANAKKTLAADADYMAREERVIKFIQDKGRVTRSQLILFAEHQGLNGAALDALVDYLVHEGDISVRKHSTAGRPLTVYEVVK